GLLPFGDVTRLSASLMIVPVRHDGKVVAILSLQSYTIGAYSAEDLATTEALADYCGNALARIRDREALRQSEALFGKVFRASPAAISIHTVREGRYIEVNDRYCEVLGYPREEVMGGSVHGLTLWARPEDRPLV